ncbi:hypothetical protein BUALT_Bualt02G0132700 [Buddleja alternifolia]|uniref:Uncharacterized protein n=1 Tax=Buddleja alternifolia TaxID=168488 RepID=A0AAV6XZX5_9LAMI|nr:hypothetical protein BUALT_Bualt02G0132700 [Buddleja alternifolia]
MDASESDETTMLSTPYFQSDDRAHSSSRVFSTSNRSVSMPGPSNCQDSSKNEHNLARFTGPSRNERRTSFVQMSDPLYVNSNREFVFQPPQDALKQKVTNPIIESGRQKHSRTSDILDAKFHTILYRDAKGWAKRISSFLRVYIPSVMNHHAKVVQWWYKFFVFSCLFAAILDPLFFFLLSMHKENKCMVFSWHIATTFVILRSMTDFIYLIHILLQIMPCQEMYIVIFVYLLILSSKLRYTVILQFRLPYVNPKSGIMGVGDIVDDPRKVARNYFFGYFGIDFFVALPLPQIIVLLILMGVMSASYARGFLQLAILVQYVPRFCNFVRLLACSSPTGFIFESVWTSFVLSPLTIVLFSHVVGSCWYLFGLKVGLFKSFKPFFI